MNKVLIISDSSIYALGNSFIRALNNLEFHVELFDLGKQISNYTLGGKIGRKINTFWPVETWERKGNRDLAIYVQNFKPEFIIVSGNAPMHYGTIAFVKSILPRCKVILFWPDTLLNLQQSQFNCAPLYDLVASYSSTSLNEFKKIGYRETMWLPFAGDLEFLGAKDQKDVFDSDITFIGGWRPERERAMVEIHNNFKGIEIKIQGPLWEKYAKDSSIKSISTSKPIYGIKYGDMLRSSRINLNIIDDTNFPAANMRFFEIPAVGGLQLSSACPEMEEIFIHHKHLFYYKQLDDLCEQITYILEHEMEMEKVRTNGIELIQSNHTYIHRMKQLIK
jgi:spore maturation protein CgeB